AFRCESQTCCASSWAARADSTVSLASGRERRANTQVRIRTKRTTVAARLAAVSTASVAMLAHSPVKPDARLSPAEVKAKQRANAASPVACEAKRWCGARNPKVWVRLAAVLITVEMSRAAMFATVGETTWTAKRNSTA